jgi:hypothetical protein
MARGSSEAALRPVRILVWAAVAATVALRAPDAGALAVARAAGARVVLEGRVPVRLGLDVFGAPGAWDGGLGWLGGLTVWLVSAAGPAAATLTTALTALLALWLVELRARERAPGAVALVATAFAALCAADALRPGGAIENAAFAAALLLLLERPGPRRALWSAALAVVWCNASPAGLLAPALAAVAALGAHLERRLPAERRDAWLAFAATALATLATPAGWTFPALAYEALRVDRALDGLVPYHPADVSDLAYRTGFVLAVLAALTFGAGRLRPGDALLWTAALLLALANGSYLAIFGVVVAPLLAASAAEALGKRGPAGPLARGPGARAVLAAAALVFALAAALGGALRPAAPADASVLARTLAADGRGHRLFCAVVDWCSEAAAASPRISVFVDGRVEAYPAAVLTEQRDLAGLKGDWRGRLAGRRIDAVLVRRDRAFATLVGSRPGWSPAGTAGNLALYVRRP